MDQRAWTEAHVAAFAFFGGVPARLVPDNLKTGVDRPDLYDPKINRSYAELAAHYGCLVDPARALEAPGQAAGRAADALCAGQLLAGPGVHRRWRRCRPRRSRWCRGGRRAAAHAGRWTAPPRPRCSTAVESRRAAAAAGASRSCWPRWSTREGRPGHPRQGRPRRCTRCRGGSSARPPTPGSPRTMVQFFLDGQLVKTHPAQGPRASRPTSATTRRRRSRSTCAPRPGAAARPPGIGPAVRAVIAELLADNALYRLRAAQGVIGLADKHDAGRLEAACARAIDGRRPVLPHRQGHPRRRHRAATSCPAAAGDGGAGRAPARPAPRSPNVDPASPGTDHPSDAVTPARTAATERRHDRPADAITDRSALAPTLRT